MFLNLLGPTPPSSRQAKSDHKDLTSSLRFVRSSTARSLALRVDPARGKICLVVPKRMSERRAWEFAASNTEWIAQQLAKMHKPVPFVDGAVIPIFGIDRTLRFVTTASRSTEFELTDEELIVKTNREDPSNNIKKYLYDLLLGVIEPMAKEKAASIGKKVSELKLRDTRGRWGSCGYESQLMFCWRLVFTPINVVDYIVSHEVAHLRHMNHSPRFWALCEKLSQDFECRFWLKSNGEKLLQYGQKP